MRSWLVAIVLACFGVPSRIANADCVAPLAFLPFSPDEITYGLDSDRSEYVQGISIVRDRIVVDADTDPRTEYVRIEIVASSVGRSLELWTTSTRLELCDQRLAELRYVDETIVTAIGEHGRVLWSEGLLERGDGDPKFLPGEDETAIYFFIVPVIGGPGLLFFALAARAYHRRRARPQLPRARVV
jgi:hypothetical protein